MAAKSPCLSSPDPVSLTKSHKKCPPPQSINRNGEEIHPTKHLGVTLGLERKYGQPKIVIG